MNKKRGIAILVFLVLLLGMIDAAWIILIKRTITTSIISGGAGIYTVSQDFDNSLLLNSSDKSASANTSIKIKDLEKDMNMSLEAETRRTNLNYSCLNYDDDCNLTIVQVYSNGTRKLLIYKNNINEEANLTLFKNIENVLEYNIACVENSCPQTIRSNITLSQA